MGAVTTAIDYTPLFVPVSRAELAQFRRDSRQRREPWAGSTVATIAVAVAAGLTGLWLVFALGGLTVSVLAADGSPVTLVGGVLPVVVTVAILATAAALGVRAWAARWEGLLRRNRFAAANGLVYVHEITAPAYPGVIFGVGEGRRTTGSYRRVTGPGLEVGLELGGYRYTTGSGKNKSTVTWGYAALRLPRRLPHMVLDARGNNGLFSASSLPLSFSRDQVLSLEGDFDRYFTLYCSAAYERDALYVFTPDLMALLIDESAAFDVEIVDDWMFLYARGGLALEQPAVVQRVFRILDTVGATARKQTQRYADETIGDSRVDLVAPRGQRLKRGYGTAGVAVIVVAVVWLAITVLRLPF